MDERYRGILDRADEHFRTVALEQPEALSCRRGCSICCHGLFEIGPADVTLVAEGLARLPAAVRLQIEARAELIMSATNPPDLRDCLPSEKEAFFNRTDAIACPALDETGGCLIYEHRPIVCRTFGLPIRNGAQFFGEECELNFTNATIADREKAAWDIQWEDELGPEDEYTIPEAILLGRRLRHSR